MSEVQLEDVDKISESESKLFIVLFVNVKLLIMKLLHRFSFLDQFR